jgi:hypothetical protein
MPRSQRFKKPTDGSVFGKIIEGAIEDASKLLNAIDFIESPQGLNIQLYPLQRLIVKCIFAVPIDYKPVKVPMWDIFREKLIYEVSEKECLHILHEEGRCNVNDSRDIPERGFNDAVVFAGRRAGKLLSVDELIPTPNGFVRNGDLKEGDDIFGEDGKTYKVKIAHPIQKEEAYKISFDDGTYTYAHAGHLWYTHTKNERKGLRRRKRNTLTLSVTKNLCACGCGYELEPIKNKRINPNRKFRRGHFLRPIVQGKIRTTEEIIATLKVVSNKNKPPQVNHSIRLPLPIENPQIELPIDPYALGLWLGYGSSASPALTTNDPELREFWYALAHSYGLDINVSSKKGTDCCTYFISSGVSQDGCKRGGRNPLLTALQKLNLINNKHIPYAYLWASQEQRLALLQGLMDTDGYCSEKGGIEFCNMNRNLAEGVYHLAASLGLKPLWNEGIATINGKECGVKYRVTWTGGLKVSRLSRKLAYIHTKFKDTQNWRYITNIEPAGTMLMRCITTTNPTGLYLFGKNFNVTHNSEVVAAIGAYKLYRLLNVRSPQEFFDIIPGSHIDFTFLAQDDKGANRLYDKLREDVNRAPFFNPYLKQSNSTWMGFVSEADRVKRDVTPSINVESRPCTTNATRSPSNLFIAFDEFAHFRSEKGSSSDEVYAAATPSAANFHHMETMNGEWISRESAIRLKATNNIEYREFQDSLILSISSPWTKVGKMYDLYKQALEDGASSGTFTIRVSTAEMNPTILPSFLHKEYTKNALTFKAEYGGQFLESSESYVTEAQVRACTDVKYVKSATGVEEPDISTARLNMAEFHPSAIGRQYFWAIDLGMSYDATAVAIGHLEYRGGAQPIHLIYDYVDRMMVGEKFDGPGVQMLPGMEKYVGFKALPLEDILSWLNALNKLMPCYRGATDQHGGQQLVQLLELNRIHNIELVNLTTTINSQMAYVLQGYVRDARCRFPFVPKFLKELRLVEAQYINKYQIRVAAPLEKGSHDDMVDAVQLCSYLAQKWLVEEGGLKLDPSGQSLLMSEQMNQPSLPIKNIDGVLMRDLQLMERMRKIQQNMANPGGEIVRNPFHHRGR